jgi:hypothetical protein
MGGLPGAPSTVLRARLTYFSSQVRELVWLLEGLGFFFVVAFSPRL